MNIVVKMKFGAHLYGMATANSDIDYKGIFMPSKEEILLGRIPNSYCHTTGLAASRNTKNDVDVDMYSLHYFIKLACEGRIVALDMLHAPEDMILQYSGVWNAIIDHRQQFYTKNLMPLKAYVRRQTSKYGIKGSRLHAVRQVLEILKKESPSSKMREIWNNLPRNELCHDIAPDAHGVRLYQVCGKSFQESTTIRNVIPVLEKFYDTYGLRARQAAENKNIDWKAVSHALRAVCQTRDILINNNIVFPLKETPMLMQVKQGQLDYLTEAAPMLESLLDEVEELSLKSTLPETVDLNFWDQFICHTVETALYP